jgi:hypothetical protein
VQEDQGKWKPFDVDPSGQVLDLHNCPNSTYNQQQGNQAPTTTTYQKKTFTPTAVPATKETLDTKRIFQILKEIDTRQYNLELKLDKIIEKIEYNTQVDTDKLIGQLETVEQVIAPLLKTQIKKASEIHQEQQQKQQKDPISVNHGEKADKFQSRRNTTTPIIEDIPDSDEYEKTKRFALEDEETDDDEDDDNKIEMED